MVTITKLKCDKKFMIYYFGLVFPRKKLYAMVWPIEKGNVEVKLILDVHNRPPY